MDLPPKVRQTHHSSSVQWILSLNSLSHFLGQVHPGVRAGVTVDRREPSSGPAVTPTLMDAQLARKPVETG